MLIPIAGGKYLPAGEEKVKSGFDQMSTTADTAIPWRPVPDKKIRMGLAGYGACRFSVDFSLQYHPNVEVVAVSKM